MSSTTTLLVNVSLTADQAAVLARQIESDLRHEEAQARSDRRELEASWSRICDAFASFKAAVLVPPHSPL